MCTDFLASGGCKRGSDCTFAHHPEELRTGRPQATANVSMADNNVVRNYFDAIRNVLVRTQMELEQLQALRGSSAGLKNRGTPGGDPTDATGKVPCSPSSSEFDDELLDPIAFSRQSTEEGGASQLSFATSSFSRQTSYDDCDFSGTLHSFSRQTTPDKDEGVCTTALKVVPLEYSVQHGILEHLMAMSVKVPNFTAAPTIDVEATVDANTLEAFAVTVKNTFIHVQAESEKMPQGARRRARSVPEVSRPEP